MSWIEYHTELRDHWKVHRLAEKLQVPYTQALGAISCLWIWCAQYAQNGNIKRFSDCEIRIAAREDALNFSKKTLQECELLTETGYINDWRKHGMKYLLSTRKRVNEHRERVTLQKRYRTVTQNVTVTPTVPYLTNQKKSISELDSDYLKKDNINNLIRLFKNKEATKKHLVSLGFPEHQIDEALGKKF